MNQEINNFNKIRPQVEAPCYQLDSFKDDVSIRCNKKMVEDILDVLSKIKGKNEEVFTLFLELKTLINGQKADSIIEDPENKKNSWTIGFTGRQCYIFMSFQLLNILSRNLSMAYISGIQINHAIHSFKTRAESMVISSENRFYHHSDNFLKN
jgi:hypothetical protein